MQAWLTAHQTAVAGLDEGSLAVSNKRNGSQESQGLEIARSNEKAVRRGVIARACPGYARSGSTLGPEPLPVSTFQMMIPRADQGGPSSGRAIETAMEAPIGPVRRTSNSVIFSVSASSKI